MVWRTADPHVHFFRSRCPHHANNLPARRATNQGIVDEHDSSPLENAANRIQLDADAEMSNSRLRLNERAADVMISDQTHSERNIRFVGVAHGRADA